VHPNGELRKEVLAVGAAVLAHDYAKIAHDRAAGFGDGALERRLDEVVALTRLAARYGAQAANLGAQRLGAGAKDLDPELERAKAVVKGELDREMRAG
jgi:hypothetical protein